MRFISFDISKTFRRDACKPPNRIFSVFGLFTATTADRFYRIDRGQVSTKGNFDVLHLCCMSHCAVLLYSIHISAGASKLCDGDLSGWAFHLGPGAGHQGDGGHVAQNAGGDGNCWGMFWQLRPVCFSCLLCRAFSTVQVDWNESLQMTDCVV